MISRTTFSYLARGKPVLATEYSVLSAVVILIFSVCGVSAAWAFEPDAIPLTPELRTRCLDVLRSGLRGIDDNPDSFWPAMHAAEGLTLAGQGSEVIGALRERLPKESDPQHRCGLAREMVRAGWREPLDVLFATLADEASNGRTHAAESLYKIAEVGDGRQLRAMLELPDKRLQLMVCAALARAGSQSALGHVRGALAHEDREIRKVSVWVLGLLGDKQDIRPINRVLAAESDELASAYCVNALACLGDGEARAMLGKNLSSADPVVRTYSAEFAGYSRAVEFRPRLIELLSDNHVDVRVRTAQTLIAFSLPRWAPGLPVAAASDDLRVDIYQATKENPRYSEGSLMALRDGSLLYATTEFAGGGADHSGATIVGRTSIDGGRTWEKQRTLQENIGRQNVMSVTLRRLGTSESAPLGMFFLIKNGPADLKAVLRISRDEGRSFEDPIMVTSGAGYHVMNNDRVTMLSSGRLICPVSWCADVVKDGHFVCLCFLSDDGGKTWRASTDRVDQPKRGAMEPEVVELADGRLLMIIRTQLGHIATSLSTDSGDHWSATSKLNIAAPEAPATIRTIPATGDLLLIWNDTFQAGSGHGGKRTPLTAAISSDGGQTWHHEHMLESDPRQGYAYTSCLFHKDRVLLSYYVHDEATGRISSRFRSLPVRWFYAE